MTVRVCTYNVAWFAVLSDENNNPLTDEKSKKRLAAINTVLTTITLMSSGSWRLRTLQPPPVCVRQHRRLKTSRLRRGCGSTKPSSAFRQQVYRSWPCGTARRS